MSDLKKQLAEIQRMMTEVNHMLTELTRKEEVRWFDDTDLFFATDYAIKAKN